MPRVKDKMVSSVVTLQPGTGVVDAAKRMIEEEKGPLPIVEGERPVAIVTDRDIIVHVVAEGRDPKSITVDDIASHAALGKRASTLGTTEVRRGEGRSCWTSRDSPLAHH